MLLRRHADALHDYISTTVADAAVAEDVFMRVFVRAWSELTPRRMPEESALPWMLATARNAALESARVRERESAPVTSDPRRALDGRSGALRVALAKLTEREQRIVELCLVEDRTYRQAVRLTRSRKRRGLRTLLVRQREWSRAAVATLRGNANG